MAESNSQQAFSHPAFQHPPHGIGPTAKDYEAADKRYEENREKWMEMHGACETCKVHPHRTICGGCDEPEEECNCAE